MKTLRSVVETLLSRENGCGLREREWLRPKGGAVGRTLDPLPLVAATVTRSIAMFINQKPEQPAPEARLLRSVC